MQFTRHMTNSIENLNEIVQGAVDIAMQLKGLDWYLLVHRAPRAWVGAASVHCRWPRVMRQAVMPLCAPSDVRRMG